MISATSDEQVCTTPRGRQARTPRAPDSTRSRSDDRGGPRGVVNTREDGEISLGERCEQSRHRFARGETTLHRYDAVVRHLSDPALVKDSLGSLADISAATTSLRVAKSLSKPRLEIRDIYPTDRLELMSCPRPKISSYWG